MSSILTNSSAMVALQTLKGINSSLAKTQDEISTGKTVASAKDNAAVWSISKVMESDVAGFKAISSSLDLGESTVAVASKASEKITDLLTQMKEKIVSAQEANVDRDKIQTDIVALRDQISSVVGAAQFNGLNLLSNKQGGASVAQIVGNTGAGAGIMGSGSINVLSSLDRNANGVTSSNINVGKTDLSTSAHTLGAGTDLAATAATGAGAIAANATSTISIVGDTTTVVRGGNKVLAGDGYKIGGLTGISADISYVARDGDTTTDIASALVDRINNEAKKAGVSFSAELDTSGANPGVKITNKTTASITTTTAVSTGGTAGGGLESLNSLDVSTENGAKAALSAIEGMIQTATSAAADFGSSAGRLETQAEFISALTDSLTTGIGSLVDADMEEASARLQALQVQQQLGVQSLSIANQAPQTIMSLFK